MSLPRPYAPLIAIGSFGLLSAAATIPKEELFPLSPLTQQAGGEVSSEEPPGPGGLTTQAAPFSGSVPAASLLRVPVSGIVPGNRPVAPDIKNPLANDAEAPQRGMKNFHTFNCSGCHAANGAGGMGPALSNDQWIHRSSPANIYLTIVQGRSQGMPAFGTLLPDQTIWELVSYIQSIAEKPSGEFGKTISAVPQSPEKEQVSATKIQSSDPWKFTEAFSNGQKPQ